MNQSSSDVSTVSIPFSGIDIFSKNIGKTLGCSGKLSNDGMFIETDTVIEPNTKLLLEFKLPNTHFSIKTYSEVKNTGIKDSEQDNMLSGLKVKFVIIDKSDKKRLEDFIESRVLKLNVDSDDYKLADFVNIPAKDIFEKTHKFWSYVEDWKEKGNYTLRKHLLTASKNRLMLFDEVTGKKEEKINMGSGNYLGLSYHPEVIKAGEKALKKYGGSSVGAPMHTGTYDVHVKLEKKLAEIKGCEEIMLFPSGYTANLGVISGLIMKDDVAILDRLAHRSILDGVALSGATMRTFRHSDMNDLQRVLKSCESKYNGKVIIVDGVYSTEGDICPLPEIVELGKKYDAKVMVDDAHAMGIIGENGRGTISHFGMEGEVDIVVGTMSKALGCVGGFVGASKEVINYLRHYGRSSVFSCNLPPQVAASALKSIEIMENEPEKIETLMKNVNYVREKLEALGFNLLDFYSAIVVVIIGNDVIGKKMAAKILEEGIYLSYFPYPAVPVGKERLRLTVMSTHTKEDLDKTIEILERVGKEYGVIDENSATDKNISSAA